MAMATTFPIYPDLQGKVVLITGIGQIGSLNSSTWGNGAATARLFAHNGARIIGCDINLLAAEYTRQRLFFDNPNTICDVVMADMTNSSDIGNFFNVAMSKYGRIDILYNNVGRTAYGDPGTMTEEAWQQQIDLNLNSVFRCCRLVLPIMERQRSGVIINNASIAAIRHIGTQQIAYATAKAAVMQFSKATGCTYASKGIRVNCVCPGLMYTPLVESLRRSSREEDREAARKVTQHNVPMGRMGDGFDVANAVVFLSSDAARYIVSHNLVIDGGITESTGTGFMIG